MERIGVDKPSQENNNWENKNEAVRFENKNIEKENDVSNKHLENQVRRIRGQRKHYCPNG